MTYFKLGSHCIHFSLARVGKNKGRILPGKLAEFSMFWDDILTTLYVVVVLTSEGIRCAWGRVSLALSVTSKRFYSIAPTTFQIHPLPPPI